MNGCKAILISSTSIFINEDRIINHIEQYKDKNNFLNRKCLYFINLYVIID